MNWMFLNNTISNNTVQIAGMRIVKKPNHVFGKAMCILAGRHSIALKIRRPRNPQIGILHTDSRC